MVGLVDALPGAFPVLRVLLPPPDDVAHGRFECRWVQIETDTACTSPWAIGLTDPIHCPIAHGEGAYRADEDTLDRLEGEGLVAFRYCDADGNVTADTNVNGSARGIAGVVNAAGNVMGMMPHPERAVEPLLGYEDGRLILGSLLDAVAAAAA